MLSQYIFLFNLIYYIYIYIYYLYTIYIHIICYYLILYYIYNTHSQTHQSPFGFHQQTPVTTILNNQESLEQLHNFTTHVYKRVEPRPCQICKTEKVMAAFSCTECEVQAMCRPCSRRLHSQGTNINHILVELVEQQQQQQCTYIHTAVYSIVQQQYSLLFTHTQPPLVLAASSLVILHLLDSYHTNINTNSVVVLV